MLSIDELSYRAGRQTSLLSCSWRRADPAIVVLSQPQSLRHHGLPSHRSLRRDHCHPNPHRPRHHCTSSSLRFANIPLPSFRSISSNSSLLHRNHPPLPKERLRAILVRRLHVRSSLPHELLLSATEPGPASNTHNSLAKVPMGSECSLLATNGHTTIPPRPSKHDQGRIPLQTIDCSNKRLRLLALAARRRRALLPSQRRCFDVGAIQSLHGTSNIERHSHAARCLVPSSASILRHQWFSAKHVRRAQHLRNHCSWDLRLAIAKLATAVRRYQGSVHAAEMV